jgi:hypothetical protein
MCLGITSNNILDSSEECYYMKMISVFLIFLSSLSALAAPSLECHLVKMLQVKKQSGSTEDYSLHYGSFSFKLSAKKPPYQADFFGSQTLRFTNDLDENHKDFLTNYGMLVEATHNNGDNLLITMVPLSYPKNNINKKGRENSSETKPVKLGRFSISVDPTNAELSKLWMTYEPAVVGKKNKDLINMQLSACIYQP